MINMLRRSVAPSVCAAMIFFAIAAPVTAQQPTDAQREAIRSACRSDYEANCASVPPGGMASLQCLQQHMSKLSSSCQQAVSAVEAPAAPKAESTPKTEPAAKTESAPATTAPAAKAAASPAVAKKPTDAQVAAIRSSCRADYPKVCASVPPGGEASLNCLEKNKAKVSAACQKSLAAVSGGAAAPAAAGSVPASAGAAVAVPAAPPPPLVLRPMLPREELFVLRSACGADVRALCGGVAPGGGRIVQCLVVRAASLSPACADVLAQFAAR